MNHFRLNLNVVEPTTDNTYNCDYGTRHKRGDLVYDIYGKKYRYITQLEEDSLVAEIIVTTNVMSDIQGEETGNVFRLSKIFTEPPVREQNTVLMELSNDIKETKELLYDYQLELRQTEIKLDKYSTESSRLRLQNDALKTLGTVLSWSWDVDNRVQPSHSNTHVLTINNSKKSCSYLTHDAFMKTHNMKETLSLKILSTSEVVWSVRTLTDCIATSESVMFYLVEDEEEARDKMVNYFNLECNKLFDLYEHYMNPKNWCTMESELPESPELKVKSILQWLDNTPEGWLTPSDKLLTVMEEYKRFVLRGELKRCLEQAEELREQLGEQY